MSITTYTDLELRLQAEIAELKEALENYRGFLKKAVKQRNDLEKQLTEPATSCKFPLCQNTDYQEALAEQIKRELYTG